MREARRFRTGNLVHTTINCVVGVNDLDLARKAFNPSFCTPQLQIFFFTFAAYVRGHNCCNSNIIDNG